MRRSCHIDEFLRSRGQPRPAWLETHQVMRRSSQVHTLFGTFARRYTDKANLESNCLTKSPSSSLHSSLSSFSHFSNKCFRFCCKIGFAISKDSYRFSPPLSRSVPKYCNIGESCPGKTGNCRSRSIVSTVRRMPYPSTFHQMTFH